MVKKKSFHTRPKRDAVFGCNDHLEGKNAELSQTFFSALLGRIVQGGSIQCYYTLLLSINTLQ